MAPAHEDGFANKTIYKTQWSNSFSTRPLSMSWMYKTCLVLSDFINNNEKVNNEGSDICWESNNRENRN